VLLVKAGDRGLAVEAVGESVARAALDRRLRSVAFSVDVDPQ
jgi:hypothetical protein